MNYWLDLFTKETWDEFRAAGASVTGFCHRLREYAKKIKKDDIFLCYVTGAKRWVGALKVLGASQDKRRIWKKHDLPVRFNVEPIVLLDVGHDVPLETLQGRLAFYASSQDRGGYKGFLRRSPNLFKQPKDGQLILDLMRTVESESSKSQPYPKARCIKKVTLRRFKCFEDTTIHLAPFTVLMGENCSGKSSILQAIAIALRVLNEKALIHQDAKGNYSPSRSGAAYAQLPGLFTQNPRDIFFAKQERGGTERGQKGIEINLEDAAGNVYKLRITAQFGAFNVKCLSNDKDLLSTPQLQNFDALLVHGFVGVMPAEERLFPLAIEARLTNGRASEVLRNLLLDVRKQSTERFERLQRKMQSYFGLELGKVDFQDRKDLYVQADYVEQFQKRPISFDLALQGSGFLQIMQLLAAIYRCCDHSKVILLDEPDAHLHPNLQVIVPNILREVAEEEGLQIIVATHSTSIIRAVQPEEVVPVSRTLRSCAPLRSTDQVETEIRQRLDNYTLAKARVAGKLIYVEDRNHDLLRALDEACGTRLFSGVSTAPILVAEGKDDPIPFRIADALEKITGESIAVHFLRDRDGLPDEWCNKLEEYAKTKKVRLHIWPFHEVENAILSTDFLHDVCRTVAERQGKPCPSIEDIERRLCTIMHDLIAMGRFHYRETLRDSLQKTARLIVDNGMSQYNRAESAASQIADGYEQLTDFHKLGIVAPGKETLRQFRDWMQKEHGVNISTADMRDQARRMTPPQAVKTILTQIAK